MVRAFNALLQDEPRVGLLRYAARKSLITHHFPGSAHGTLVGMMREVIGSMRSPARQTGSPCAHGCRYGRQTRAGIHSRTVHHSLSHRSFLTAKKWGNAKWQDWRLVGGAPRRRHDADPDHIVEQRGVRNKHGMVATVPADLTNRLLFSPRRPHRRLTTRLWRHGFRVAFVAPGRPRASTVTRSPQSLTIQLFVFEQSQNIFVNMWGSASRHAPRPVASRNLNR